MSFSRRRFRVMRRPVRELAALYAPIRRLVCPKGQFRRKLRNRSALPTCCLVAATARNKSPKTRPSSAKESAKACAGPALKWMKNRIARSSMSRAGFRPGTPPIQAYVIPVEETLQIAHECSQAIQSSKPGGRRNRVPDNRSIDRIARCSKATSKRRDASISGMIRKLKSGQFRLYSRKKNPSTGKRRNLGTFSTLEQAKQHEREVQYFKKH
jgi:hypothetical protein